MLYYIPKIIIILLSLILIQSDNVFNDKTIIESEIESIDPIIKEEIINEINELKENYFVLIQTIQENVKKSHVDLKDELGFDLEDTSNHTNIEQMVNELIANVNRIRIN